MSRARAERQGRKAEQWAALYLRAMGWRIVGHRIKTPRGEIDLIARRGRMVAFIEVKWRKTARQLDNAIDEHRLRRVAAAAQAVEHLYASKGETVRIDVLLLAPWHWPRHMINAWQP